MVGQGRIMSKARGMIVLACRSTNNERIVPRLGEMVLTYYLMRSDRVSNVAHKRRTHLASRRVDYCVGIISNFSIKTLTFHLSSCLEAWLPTVARTDEVSPDCSGL